MARNVYPEKVSKNNQFLWKNTKEFFESSENFI